MLFLFFFSTALEKLLLVHPSKIPKRDYMRLFLAPVCLMFKSWCLICLKDSPTYAPVGWSVWFLNFPFNMKTKSRGQKIRLMHSKSHSPWEDCESCGSGVIFFFFFRFIYSTSFREQDEAYMNSLRWSTLVGLEPAYTWMWVAHSTNVLWTPIVFAKAVFLYCSPNCLSCPPCAYSKGPGNLGNLGSTKKIQPESVEVHGWVVGALCSWTLKILIMVWFSLPTSCNLGNLRFSLTLQSLSVSLSSGTKRKAQFYQAQ